ncbi:MAG: hypothetical protein OXN89_05290, partial [Bryobacterales bacterium]|nr:hypothetical protein [Bryobacterales bacterium]
MDRLATDPDRCKTFPAKALWLVVVSLAGGHAISAEIAHLSIGVTSAGSPIRAGVHLEALDPSGETTRVLVVGGLDGTTQSTELAAALLRNAGRYDFAISAVANAFPDRPPVEQFPPPGPAYGGEAVEAQHLWRFAGMLAPDLVVDLRFDDGPSALAVALGRGATPAAVGRIPAATLRFQTDGLPLPHKSRAGLLLRRG